MKKTFRCLGLILTAVIVFSCISNRFVHADNIADSDTSVKTLDIWEIESYDNWFEKNKDNPIGTDNIHVDVAENDCILDEGTQKEFKISVKKGGFYNLKIGYTAIPGESLFSSPIELSFMINGTVQYREASSVSLTRVFESTKENFETDDKGNHIQPTQVEKTYEREYILSDSSGYHTGGLFVLLNEGDNTVSISALRSGIKLSFVELSILEEPISYKEYKAKFEGEKNTSQNAKPIYIEAEKIYRKSDCTITPATDRSTTSVTPNSPNAMLLNTIGGSFNRVGQWVSWKFDVKESGFYTISFYAKQSINSGAISTRKLLIDGEVPFNEAQNLRFSYSDGYKNYVLSSNKEEFYFYFEKGTHEIALEAVLGDMSEYLNRVSNTLSSLNDDYLKILFYTGSNPDIYRDYGFKRLIPEVLEDFIKQSKSLKQVSKGVKELSESRGNSTATLDKLADILYKMGNDTDEIAKNFSLFKDNLSALGTWINDYAAQPLQIDSISVTPKNVETDNKKENLFSNLWFKVRIFITSFVDDYADEKSATETVSVWLATGRDQSKIISRLVNSDSSTEGITAKVSLVAADALLPNVLAGSDIDVFLNATAADPINYAIRGAVLDLKQFEDFDEVAKRFNKAAFTPFEYNGAVYALPESFDFPLMFYRKDIFNNLGITVPKTWDDFYEVVAILQKNNLTAGVTWTEMFNLMLYQSGGSYYNKEKTESALGEFVSLTAFEKTIKLYSEYGLPVEFSFPSRFRSGDMPLGIVSYTMYNQLYLFAPEIDGLWEFTSVPGVVDENGNINNSVIGGGTAAIMLKTTKNKDAAWKFLKWWTDTNTQIDFGIEMEKIMGAAVRQSSANIDVVKGFPWSAEEFAVINKQWNHISSIPQIPGSYYIGRTLDFAFNTAYTGTVDSSRTLLDNVNELNEEIVRKTKEFERN